MTDGDGVMTWATPFDDDAEATNYTWAKVREKLQLTSNVANARWMPEKLIPIIGSENSGLFLTEKGRPTKLGVQVLFRYKAFVIDQGNDYEEFKKQVLDALSVEPETVVIPEVMDLMTDDDSPVTSGDKGGAIARREQQILVKRDDLEDLVMTALRARQELEATKRRTQTVSGKSREQEVFEEEVQRLKDELEWEKRKLEIRESARQLILGNEDS